MRAAALSIAAGAVVGVLALGLTTNALQAGGAVRLPQFDSAPQCSAPMPSTPAGEAALFRRLPVDTWGGGDLAVSAALPDGRSVWIFADTLSGADSGHLSRFVHSSAIVQDDGCLHVSRGGAQLLPDTGPGVFAWPTGAVAVGADRVLISAGLIRVTGSCPFCFEQVGMRGAIATVDRAGDVIFDRWTPSWPAGDGGIVWGTGLSQDGDRVVMYGLSPTGLARELYLASASPADAVAGRWQLSPTPVAHDVDPAGVSAYRDATGWHVVTVRGTQVLRLDAAAPSGPFVEMTIGAVPPSDGARVFYAAAVHPQLRMSSGAPLLTVCRNYLDGQTRPVHAYQPLYLAG